MTLPTALHIVFDSPPGPAGGGRFVEVETPDGKSINAGEWHRREDGLWELVIDEKRQARYLAVLVAAMNEEYRRQYDVLRKCQDRFAEYVELHKAKGTPEGDEKAARNQEMVDLLDTVLLPF